MKPDVYIIAGPNGAGKTTFAVEFLPKYAECPNFVNADLIAQGIAPFAPETAAVRAGRLMLQEIERLAQDHASFGFETTLSGRGYLHLIQRLKARGYQVHFFFLWVPSVDLALSRVQRRVLEGGHKVREDDVRRRFDRSIRNFLLLYRQLANSWIVFDNSGEIPAVIALQKQGKLRIIKTRAYEAIVTPYEKSNENTR
jgi:predicted ABC-type ATPase